MHASTTSKRVLAVYEMMPLVFAVFAHNPPLHVPSDLLHILRRQRDAQQTLQVWPLATRVPGPSFGHLQMRLIMVACIVGPLEPLVTLGA